MADKSKGTANQETGEFPSGPVAGTALYDGVTFIQKGLQYANIEGMAFEAISSSARWKRWRRARSHA
jgi:hypothetical protein